MKRKKTAMSNKSLTPAQRATIVTCSKIQPSKHLRLRNSSHTSVHKNTSMDLSTDANGRSLAAATDQELKFEYIVTQSSNEASKLEFVVASNTEVSEKSIATEQVCESTSRVDSSTDSVTEANSSSFEDNCNAIPSLRFPQKLWRIVNECRSGAIGWGPDGLSLIVDYESFQREYLSGLDSGIFKTSNMASFIRQLNLYGFRKLTSHNRDMFGAKTVCMKEILAGPEQKVHEFLHENFRQGRLDLLSRVCRKTGVKKNNQLARQAKLLKDRRTLKVDVNESRGSSLTRLQMCQLALTEALAQATKQYHKEKELWLQAIHNDTPEDTVETNHQIEPVAEPLQIEIIFQDLPNQFQNVESMPIIDATALENVIDNQERIQWSEVLTLPGENAVTISVPYL